MVDVVAEHRQPYPLPADVRYVLDNLLNESGLDEGTYMALNLFVPRAPVMALVDQPREGRGWWPRLALGADLMAAADRHLATLPQEVHNGIAGTSLQWLRRDLVELAKVYSSWALEDETTGGAMRPWLRRRRIRPNGDIEKRTSRRLHSPAFVARMVRRYDESAPRRAMATRILDRVDRATELTDFLFTYARELEEQRERARQEALRLFRDEDARKRINAPEGRYLRRKRAVIRRAVRAASMVLPAPQISGFARGEAVRLPGRTLDLMVKLEGGLADPGHGTLQVQAVAPGAPTPLASLCVYHERIPALDQITALALAMSAGEEAGIVGDANIVQMFPLGRENAFLAAREQRDIAKAEALGRRAPGTWTTVDRSYWSYYEGRRARADEYWEATKAMWVERLAVFACGRRVKRLGAMI